MPRLSFCFRTVLLPLLAVALVACAPARNDMSQTPAASESGQEQSPPPRRKLNPAPRRAYRITLTIADAPGPFAAVEGVAQYDVDNEAACGKVNPSTGTPYRMTTLELFDLRKVSDTEYTGTVYADLILDEDYYGKGVCRWEFTSVEIQLKATGDQAETRFLPDITGEQVFAQQSTTTFFLKRFYPRNPKIDDFPDFGQKNRSKLAPQISDSDLFIIALSAKEEQP
jgi:hypothetical protein